MIAMLRGTVADISLLHVILDVGGVGYLISVRKPGEFQLGREATLHTHLAVRENALDLYGFQTRDELAMFALLLTIPKIGPKSAMQILTQADIPLLITSITRNDAVYLSKMSGISKKTSEKIVVELQNKFDGVAFSDTETTIQGEDADLVDALIALGYSQKDARDALLKLPVSIEGTNARIKEALKFLGS